MALNSKKSRNPIKILTGKVKIHANAILTIVFFCRFFTPPEATILPAIPEDRTCVVLTGKWKKVESPMVEAAINSAVAPSA